MTKPSAPVRVSVLALLISFATRYFYTIPMEYLTSRATQNEDTLAGRFAGRVILSIRGCYDRKYEMTTFQLLISGHNQDYFDNRKVLRLAQALIDKGCDPDQKAAMGWAPLHMAVLERNIDLIKFLVANGADPGIPIGAPKGDRNNRIDRFVGKTSIDLVNEGISLQEGGASRAQLLNALEVTRMGT